MAITAVGADEPDDESSEQPYKSIYDGYVSHNMDYAEQELIRKKRERLDAANARFKKTGDARHPNTIRADKKKEYKENRAPAEAEAAIGRWFDRNPNMRTNAEGDVVNPADFNACSTDSRSGSFSHGNNSCGCAGCV